MIGNNLTFTIQIKVSESVIAHYFTVLPCNMEQVIFPQYSKTTT